MHGLRDSHMKWSTSDWERQVSYDTTYVNPSNTVHNRVAPVKGHYRVSFRHPKTGKLLKTASLFSKKPHPIETQPAWVLLWTRRDMNPPPFPASCPLKLSKRLKTPPFSVNATLCVWPLSSLGKWIKTFFSSLLNTSVNSFTARVGSRNNLYAESEKLI